MQNLLPDRIISRLTCGNQLLFIYVKTSSSYNYRTSRNFSLWNLNIAELCESVKKLTTDEFVRGLEIAVGGTFKGQNICFRLSADLFLGIVKFYGKQIKSMYSEIGNYQLASSKPKKKPGKTKKAKEAAVYRKDRIIDLRSFNELMAKVQSEIEKDRLLLTQSSQAPTQDISDLLFPDPDFYPPEDGGPVLGSLLDDLDSVFDGDILDTELPRIIIGDGDIGGMDFTLSPYREVVDHPSSTIPGAQASWRISPVQKRPDGVDGHSIGEPSIDLPYDLLSPADVGMDANAFRPPHESTRQEIHSPSALPVIAPRLLNLEQSPPSEERREPIQVQVEVELHHPPAVDTERPQNVPQPRTEQVETIHTDADPEPEQNQDPRTSVSQHVERPGVTDPNFTPDEEIFPAPRRTPRADASADIREDPLPAPDAQEEEQPRPTRRRKRNKVNKRPQIPKRILKRWFNNFHKKFDRVKGPLIVLREELQQTKPINEPRIRHHLPEIQFFNVLSADCGFDKPEDIALDDELDFLAFVFSPSRVLQPPEAGGEEIRSQPDESDARPQEPAGMEQTVEHGMEQSSFNVEPPLMSSPPQAPQFIDQPMDFDIPEPSIVLPHSEQGQEERREPEKPKRRRESPEQIKEETFEPYEYTGVTVYTSKKQRVDTEEMPADMLEPAASRTRESLLESLTRLWSTADGGVPFEALCKPAPEGIPRPVTKCPKSENVCLRSTAARTFNLLLGLDKEKLLRLEQEPSRKIIIFPPEPAV